jgi:ribose transport system permease protein
MVSTDTGAIIGARGPGRPPTTRMRAFAAFEALDVWIILAAGLILATVLVPNFATEYNIGNLLGQCSILGVVAIGQYLVIVSGEFDLSVGAMLAAASVVFVTAAGHGFAAGFAAALVVCLAIGVLNGVMTTFGRVPSLIVTLATLGIARGLAFAVTETGVPNPSEALKAFADAGIWFIPASTLVWLGLALIVAFVLRFTGLDIHLLAVGGNETAAHAAGIRVRSVRIGAFVVTGALVAIAALLFVARTRSGIPQGGAGLELQSIAAIVIGGTRLFGGEGSLPKAMAGVLIFVMIRNVLGLAGVDPFVVDIVTAAVILLAVGVRTIGQPQEI